MLINFIIFQGNWLLCILSAARGEAAIGIASVLLLPLLHLALHPTLRRSELGLLVLLALTGTLVDSVFLWTDTLRYATNPLTPYLAPPWITALWIGFGTALNYCLAWLRGRVVLQITFGALGGPLAYWGGQRLGALEWGASPEVCLGALALCWGAITPAAYAVAARLGSRAGDLPTRPYGGANT